MLLPLFDKHVFSSAGNVAHLSPKTWILQKHHPTVAIYVQNRLGTMKICLYVVNVLVHAAACYCPDNDCSVMQRVMQRVMPQQGMQHHPAGVVVHVELAEMQHPGMPPLEMDPHVGLGLLRGVIPLLTGMHPPRGMPLLPLSEGRGKRPHQPGVGVGGRLSLEESWSVSNIITTQRVA